MGRSPHVASVAPRASGTVNANVLLIVAVRPGPSGVPGGPGGTCDGERLGWRTVPGAQWFPARPGWRPGRVRRGCGQPSSISVNTILTPPVASFLTWVRNCAACGVATALLAVS
jgi:hypothetical protein